MEITERIFFILKLAKNINTFENAGNLLPCESCATKSLEIVCYNSSNSKKYRYNRLLRLINVKGRIEDCPGFGDRLLTFVLITF